MVISEPDENNCVLCVNITDYDVLNDYDDPNIDKSCILLPPSHEFITKPSRVYYEDARVMRINVIEDEIRKRTFIQKPDITDGILIKVQNGCKKTDALPKKLKKYFSLF